MNKAPDAFRTISEVADELDLPQHVLRFWESRFPHIRPMKRGGGRRYYRPEDVDLLRGIRHLLYGDGYTIRGVQRILREPEYEKRQLMQQFVREFERKFEELEGIAIWRYNLPLEGEGAKGYAIEYLAALTQTFILCWRVLLRQGFDVIHACNPPDLFFLIGWFFKLFNRWKITLFSLSLIYHKENIP